MQFMFLFIILCFLTFKLENIKLKKTLKLHIISLYTYTTYTYTTMFIGI
jgi:hypothetical protein